jgi:integrase/recombinase XerC
MEITILSSIFTLAQDNELVGLNPCRKLRWKREETRSRRERVLDADEEKRLIVSLLHYPEAHHAATLALHTGLRRMEILNLRLSDFDLNTGKLSVIGKGGKRRVVPLNPVAEKVARELMSRPTGEGFLFHSRTGNTLSHKQGAFQSAVCAAKITDLHFHDLRHTFSTRMRALTDPFTLKELLGHSKIETTEGYVTPSMAEMKAAVEGLAQTTSKVLPIAAALA